MKHDPSIVAVPTQESSPIYDEVVLVSGDYRIIIGKETRRYAKQYIVQKLQGGSYRNLSDHLEWNSIGSRYGAWLVNPDTREPAPKL